MTACRALRTRRSPAALNLLLCAGTATEPIKCVRRHASHNVYVRAYCIHVDQFRISNLYAYIHIDYRFIVIIIMVSCFEQRLCVPAQLGSCDGQSHSCYYYIAIKKILKT